jgi:glycine/D-amino acid oxidase-like deaminating enzyme
MLQRAVTLGVNLQTNTPVTSVAPGEIHPKSPTWIVNTPRGSLTCNTIIHATNGYTSALVPELQGKIVPVKGIVARLVPTNAPRLTESYMMRFSDYEYDYMIPRPDGSIVVGGGRRDYYHDLSKWFNVSDDGSIIEGAENYFDGYMQRHFHGWEDCDVRTEDVWTGSESSISHLTNYGHLC